MAEKRVSVRLVVEGGRVVRAELDGVGASGERAFNRIERSGDAVGGMMRRVAGLFAAGFSLASIGRAAEQFTMIGNTLRALGLDQVEVNDRMDRLTDIALRTRQPLADVAALYQRVTMASSDLGASQEEIYRFIEATSNALAIQGTPAQTAAGALLQLGQALGAGIVRAEEWNSIIEGAPAIARAAAAGWGEAGVSVAELRREIIEGRVTSDAFFAAVLSQSDALAEAFGNTQQTVGQAVTNLNTALINFVGRLDETLGASDAVVFGIQTLAENLDVAGAIATGLVATQIPALVAGLRAVGVAATLAGGPLGLVIGLVAAGGAYLLFFRERAERVPDALDDVTTAQNTLNTALGTFATTGAPEAGRQAIGYARNLETQAEAALAAAEAEIVLMEAELARFQSAPVEERGLLTGDMEEGAMSRNIEAAQGQAAVLRATIEGARQTVFDLRDSVSAIPGATVPALATTGEAVDAVSEALTRAGAASREATDQALSGWQAVGAQLANFSTEASNVAEQVGSTMTSSMKRLEDAILDAFKGGTGGARAFFGYIAEELARVAIRNTIIAPVSNWLGRALGGLFGGATARVMHTGGVAGAGGASRSVDPAIFAAAPRYHTGGIAGLAPDEIPAILQRGERVIPRGQSSRQQIDIVLHGMPEGVTMDDVRAEAFGIAVNVTSRALGQNRRALGGNMRDFDNRGV